MLPIYRTLSTRFRILTTIAITTTTTITTTSTWYDASCDPSATDPFVKEERILRSRPAASTMDADRVRFLRWTSISATRKSKFPLHSTSIPPPPPVDEKLFFFFFTNYSRVFCVINVTFVGYVIDLEKGFYPFVCLIRNRRRHRYFHDRINSKCSLSLFYARRNRIRRTIGVGRLISQQPYSRVLR